LANAENNSAIMKYDVATFLFKVFNSSGFSRYPKVGVFAD
jgi:hypothetical protein